MIKINNGGKSAAITCIYPLEAQRAIIATSFAKRICSGMATGPEVEFMRKFMDTEINDGWFEDVSDYVAAVESVTSAA